MRLSSLLLAAAVATPPDPGPAVPNWSAPPYWAPSVAGSAVSSAAGTERPEPETTPTAPLVLIGIAPCRIVDTRGTAGVPYNTGGKLAGGESRPYDLNSAPAPCNGIPAGTEAFSVNVTATEPEGPGYLSTYPTGPVPDPLTSILNYATGENVANATVVPSDANGSITILTSTAVHVVVDVNGYYAPLSSQTGAVVTSLAGGTGALTLSGTNGITASRVGQAITVTSNATSSATVSTIAARDANGLLRSSGLDVGALQGPSTLVFANGSRFLHRTAGSLYLGTSAGSLSSTCTECLAVGKEALAFSTGLENTAVGALSARSLATGDGNTAVGRNSMGNATFAQGNVAVGAGAMTSAVSGPSRNVAVGSLAGSVLSAGDNNVFLGAQSGAQLNSGSNNIHVGFQVGLASFGSESGTIRIGNQSGSFPQTSTYIAGISGQSSPSGVTVLVNSSGKLGAALSSRRYKIDVEDVGDRSEVLSRLRPVTFLYREDLDPDRVRQYGLIAEEVAEVAPDLVLLGEDGRPQTVRYHLLVPLLLDALQKQQRLSAAQSAELAGQKARADAQQREIEELRRAIATHRDRRQAD